MIDPESIQVQIVRDALYVYGLFWGTCYWSEKAQALQAEINASGLSIPVPVIDLAGEAPDIPAGCPLAQERPYFKTLRYGNNLDGHARKIAQVVARAGLPVFYLDNSRAIDLTLNDMGGAIEEVALYAPVLVYCHQPDRRGDDISRFLPRLYSRASGFCWLIEEGL
jgi:hypothetical protein